MQPYRIKIIAIAETPHLILYLTCCLLSVGTDAVKGKFNHVVNSFLFRLAFFSLCHVVDLMRIQTFVLIDRLDVKLNFSWTNKAIGIKLKLV